VFVQTLQRLRNPGNRVLIWALGISLAVHAGLLLIRFTAPETFERMMGQSPLEIVLVNAQANNTPKQAQALAQVNLEGGGDADKGMAKSPLPDSGRLQDGDNLQELKKRVEELEAEQAKLYAEYKSNDIIQKALETTQKANPLPNEQDTNETVLARKAAAIEKQMDQYNKRPRRKEISPATKEVEYATYYAAWRDKIEKVGTDNYPPEARGKLYGELIITVSIWSDGRIENITIHKSSGQAVLDKAAIRIFKIAAPYGQFSEKMREKYQVFDITTRFIFAKGELEVRSVQ
jgi:protein TonB